jgi:hypothetical protein
VGICVRLRRKPSRLIVGCKQRSIAVGDYGGTAEKGRKLTDHQWPNWIIRGFCIATFLAGSVLIVGGLPGGFKKGWPETFVSAGAAMIASSLAAFIGLQAAVSWRQQRRRELEVSEHRHREDVYERLVTHMTESFVGSPSGSSGPKQPEALIRSQVLVWGSPETISALRSWHEQTFLVMTQYGGSLAGHPEVKSALWDRYFDVVLAIRKELGSSSAVSSLTKDLVLGMIFGDYPVSTSKNPD